MADASLLANFQNGHARHEWKHCISWIEQVRRVEGFFSLYAFNVLKAATWLTQPAYAKILCHLNFVC